jgi:hypothetical protein
VLQDVEIMQHVSTLNAPAMTDIITVIITGAMVANVMVVVQEKYVYQDVEITLIAVILNVNVMQVLETVTEDGMMVVNVQGAVQVIIV